jgi:anaerobic ribonucleoside-triphosphate reductase
MNINMSLCKEFEELYDRFLASSNGLALLEIEGISPKKLDVGALSHEFFENKLSDIATDGNSNATQSMSPTEYRTHIVNNQMKLLGYHTLWYHTMKRYGLEFANKAIWMIWSGDLYFHDAHGVKIQMPYCYAFSLSSMIQEGRPYGPSPNTAPKHKKSYLSQVDKLISDLSKQFAGAVAPSDFFLWYAYFCQEEGLDPRDPDHRDEMIQDFQGIVCLLNEPSRAEGESPFTNFGCYDKIGLQNLFGHIYYPNLDKADLDYIMEIQKIFMEWFSKGNPTTGFPYRFPVVTVNLTTDDHGDFIDDDFAMFTAEVDRNMGNFNVHFGDKAKLAMCCRYENDLDDMDMSPDSFGNGGVNIGSHRVVTINTVKASRMANNEDEYYDMVDDYMDVASKLLIVHRYDILEKRIQKNPGYLQFFGELGWFNLNTMFSTIGITGINETCGHMLKDILDDDGTDFVLDSLSHIKDNIKKYRKEYGVAFNIEEIPGEQTCVTLAKKDALTLGDINEILYSNQYIPLTAHADILTRIDLSGRFMKMVSGGGIVHLNIENRLDTTGKMYELLKLCAKSGINHVAICHRFGKCTNGHTHIIGQARKCPECGADIEIAVNRVIGYYSEERNWTKVRQLYDAEDREFNDANIL